MVGHDRVHGTSKSEEKNLIFKNYFKISNLYYKIERCLFKVKLEEKEALQSVRKNEPCDFKKMRDDRRSGKGNPLRRDGSIDVTRLIFSDTF